MQLTQNAIQSATDSIKKGEPVSIPLADFNGDGKIDRIVSGINRAIDTTGDGKADIIGTLIDTTGDGKADTILDQAGNIIKANSDIVKIIGDSDFKLEDLKYIHRLLNFYFETK